MTAHSGPFHLVALVLLAAGASKVVRPDGLRPALRAIRLPDSVGAALAVAAVEVVAGAYALASGGRVAAAAVGLIYVALTIAVVGLRRAGASDCACFGARRTPPSTIHVVIDAVSASAALVAVLVPIGGVLDVVSDRPLLTTAYGGFLAIGAYLVYALESLLGPGRRAFT